jgi:predicted nucleotidyltransferase
MQLDRGYVFAALEQNRETIRRIGVERLGLFGSCARGDAVEPNDLDFVVELKIKSFDAYMDLKFFLEDLFECPVDLVLQSTIKPQLRPQIMKELIDVPGL